MSFGFSVGDFIAVLDLAKNIRKRFVDSPNQFRAISDEVKSLSNILRDLDDLVPERDLTNLQKTKLAHITQACGDILREVDKVIYKYCILDTKPNSVGRKSRQLWKRLQWEPDDVKELRSRIVSNITMVNTFVALLNASDSAIIREPITRLDKQREDEERRLITDWLSPIDFSLLQCDYTTKRQDGTGEWLLNSVEYKTWLDEAGQTLYCPGMPGAGKTIITSIVIDNLWSTFQAGGDIGVAFLYCSYKRKQEHTFENLIASLLKQLVQERHTLPDEIKSLYERHVDRRTRPSSKEIITVLGTVIASYSRVFMIIDALDECASTDRQQLLKEVFSLQSQAQINIFATSRILHNIKLKFSESSSIEIRASKEDVERYLERQMHHLPTCVMKNPALQREVATEITKAVDGMFLLAQLHLDSLKHKTTRKAIKLAIQNLPKGLDTAYNEAIERIEAQAPDHVELAKGVLLWITHAQRPLSVMELQHALAVEAGDTELYEDNIPEVEDLTAFCAGLVVIDEESNIIRLVHYTTQEYFERTCSSWIPDAQTNISKTCLTYLSFDVFSVGFCSSDEELEALLRDNVLMWYASRFWGFHIREASIDRVEPSFRVFSTSESNICCSSQLLMVSEYPYPGYSQEPAMQVSATHLAAYFGLDEILRYLLGSGHPTDPKDSHGQTPLSYAAMNGHEAVIKLLIARDDVKADSRDNNGQTPLFYAAMSGHEAVIKLLIARDDVKADSRNNNGLTPLFYAAINGYEAVIKLLIARDDVKADSRDNNGWTPLFYAAMSGHEAVIKLLIARDDVKADSRNNNGLTPLFHAAINGHEAVIKLLIARDDVKADSRDNYGWTPLFYAAMNGHEAVIKLLIARDDVKADSRDNYGWTPLFYAAMNGHEAVIKLLIARDDVKADSRDTEGRTPLSYASEHGHEAVVKVLVAYKDVKVHSPDLSGRTPLSYAMDSDLAPWDSRGNREAYEAVIKILESIP